MATYHMTTLHLTAHLNVSLTPKLYPRNNKGNADLYFESFRSELDEGVIAHYGGFMGDNAALSEAHETMERVLEFCKKHDDEAMNDQVERNGVRLKVLVTSDMFHA